ncbi:polyprenyl synthetase family protein [bacterium]|nr:polyprenyl synthetase family protein [bacterium]
MLDSATETFSLSAYWDDRAARVEEALTALLAPRRPEPLWEAMAYSVVAGGKRLRPLLVLAACEAAGGRPEAAMGAACAMELVHTQSLVHDDLPCMDNDTLRRGRPTNHVVYGEALALLAGDGLLTYAFQVLAEDLPRHIPAARAAGAIAEFARATLGMVAGQVVDVRSEGQPIDKETLEYIHRHKTGELLRVACRLGAHAAEADDATLSALTAYAEALGLAFQIVDDLLDLTGTAEELGKSPGKDAAVQKATYPALYGVEAARAEAERQIRLAEEALAPLGAAATPLRAIARFVSERKH